MRLFKNKSKQEYKSLKSQFEKLKQEIHLATEFVENITEKDLDTIYLGEADFTEASKLSKALQGMQAKLHALNQAEKERNWSIEGQAKFGEILRKYSQNIAELSDYILKFLVDYLEANQGGVFILNQEDTNHTFLELKACYAYERKKFNKKHIHIQEDYAEGLIGQTFLEGKITHLKNIPQDYVRITSGLGDANPNHLIILPLKNNDEKIGIIEIASFNPIAHYQIDFLEKVSESIATSISMVKSNETTHRLLKASQHQAETLRAQEEELRQNNEELLTTQEEMQRRGNELSSQIDTINRSGIIFIEFNEDGIIQEANQALYDTLQLTSADVIQQPQSVLYVDEDTYKQEQTKLWASLLKGIAHTGEYRFKSQDHSEKWFKGGYTPILDSSQEIHKVILIAFDITESKKQMQEIQKQGEQMKLQEIVLTKHNQKLNESKKELQKKIEEIEIMKAEEKKRLQERDAKAQVWVNKLKDKFTKQEAELRAAIQEKDNLIKELENKLIKLN